MIAPAKQSALQPALFTSKSEQWYTPPEIVAFVLGFFGQIDLDPCADPHCSIPARRHETEFGLQARWEGRVYCNPPYGRQISLWITKAMTEPVTEIILLVPGRIDTRWFKRMNDCALLFIEGRLKFSGAKDCAPFPSILAYRGDRPGEFAEYFKPFGDTFMKFNS